MSNLLICYVLFLADSPLSSSRGHKPRQLITKFVRFLTTTPFKDVVSDYSHLADELLRSGSLYGTGTTTGAFIEGMKETPVFMEYYQYFKDGNAACLQYVLSFLLFCKKAEVVDPSLEPDAFRKWFNVEVRLKTLELPADVLQDLRSLLTLALAAPEEFCFSGRFSKGTTTKTGRSVAKKIDHLRYDPYVDRTFFRAYNGTRRGYDPDSVLPDPEKWIQARSDALNNPPDLDSELLFVPKDVKSLRSICRENPTKAYFQQAVRGELEAAMKNGYMKHFIDLNDQTPNQDLAIFGSMTGLIDTIDLSSASDSVSWKLVKAVFPPHFLRLMQATRSHVVLYENSDGPARFEVEKFAPMGSAVCFPTQCLIYAAVVLREALRWTVGPKWNDVIKTSTQLETFIYKSFTNDYSTEKLQPIRVFGDDILCDTRLTEKVVQTLISLGFCVNLEKSFTASAAIRESCGVYAWCGEDITPLRYKLHHHGEELEMAHVVGMVDFINRAGDLRYLHVRRGAIHLLLNSRLRGIGKRDGRLRKLPIRFTSDRNSFGIYTNDPRNDHLCQRSYHARKLLYSLLHKLYVVCKDIRYAIAARYMSQYDVTDRATYWHLQRDEVYCVMPHTPHKGADLREVRDKYEYTQWVCSASKRGDYTPDKGVRRDATVEVVTPTWGWTPTG